VVNSFFIFLGYPPFFGTSDKEILSLIKKGKYTFEGTQ
jgi:calcium-dependent protein kinase